MSQHVEKTGEIDAPVEKVYQVVADVTKYPHFLPGVKEVKKEGDIVEMTVNFGPANVSWKSKAIMVENKSIAFELVKGPFKQMDGRWEFTPKGDKTEVKYSTDFQLNLKIPGINKIAAKGIEANTNSTIDAFRKRIMSG